MQFNGILKYFPSRLGAGLSGYWEIDHLTRTENNG